MCDPRVVETYKVKVNAHFKFCQQVVTLGCLVSWCSRKCCNRRIGNLLEEPPSLYDMGCARWLLIALADPSSAGGDFNSNSSPQLVKHSSWPANPSCHIAFANSKVYLTLCYITHTLASLRDPQAPALQGLCPSSGVVWHTSGPLSGRCSPLSLASSPGPSNPELVSVLLLVVEGPPSAWSVAETWCTSHVFNCVGNRGEPRFLTSSSSRRLAKK